MSAVAPYRHRLLVRYGECDPQGVVFNANYLLYADVAFTEYMRAAVGPWQQMLDSGYDAVVAEAALRFRASATFDDELDLLVGARRLGETSLTTSIIVMRGDDRLVEIDLRHVCVDVSSRGKAPWPEWIRSGLAPTLESEGRD